jgi:hypothetical protein
MRFRYYKGVRYVASHKPAPATFARCLSCFRAWDDDKSTGLTPTPAGRCPFEYWHKAEKLAPPSRVKVLESALQGCVDELELHEIHARQTGDTDLLARLAAARKALD